MFVGGVVVRDQMNLEIVREVVIEVVEKGQKLLVSMARRALRDDRSVEHMERGEQGGGAVSIVVVGDPFNVAQAERQHWLGSLERLDLALLVHPQYQRFVRRVEIKPAHVPHLCHQKRIGGELAAPAAVRLQTEQREIARYRAFGDAGLLGHRAHAPRGRGLGLAVEHPVDQPGALLVAVAARASRSQLIVQPRQALLYEAPAPFTHRRQTPRKPPRDGAVAGARRRPQYQFGAGYQRLRHGARGRQAGPLRLLLRAQLKLRLGSSGLHPHLSLSGKDADYASKIYA